MAVIVGENFSYTYNGTLLTEVFFRPSVSTPSLDSLFRIIPGSDALIQIPTLGNLSKIIAAGDNCNRALTGSGINVENQTVTLSKIKMLVQECAEEFEGATSNILAENWLKDGVDINDITGTQLETVINTVVEDALRRDIFNIVSWGDASDADPFYSIMEGLWPTLVTGVGSGDVTRATTVLGVGALAPGAALASMKEVYEESDAILDQLPENQKVFAVTRSVFDNLVSSYESVSTGSDLQVGYQQDGIPQVRYRGVPVIKISQWDAALADATNPNNGVIEHAILYTTRENHVLGVQNTADLNRVRGWYSIDDDVYNFDAKMRLGYNYVHSGLTTVAF